MNRIPAAAVLALLVAASFAACKKKDEPSPVPSASTPPPIAAPVPAPAPAPAATVSVTSVQLGNAVGPDHNVTAPATEFKKTDTIYAAVVTDATGTAGPVPGKLTAKWTYGDGQAVSEETRDFNFTGPGVTEFHIAKPDGWPLGKYKVDVMLDGTFAASKEFEVK